MNIAITNARFFFQFFSLYFLLQNFSEQNDEKCENNRGIYTKSFFKFSFSSFHSVVE